MNKSPGITRRKQAVAFARRIMSEGTPLGKALLNLYDRGFAQGVLLATRTIIRGMGKQK